MKIARMNNARKGRGYQLARMFQSATKARVFWVSAGMMFFGLMASGWLYSHSLPGRPLQSQPTQQDESVSTPIPAALPEESSLTAVAVEPAAPKPEVIATEPIPAPEIPPAACNEGQRNQAVTERDNALLAENERLNNRVDTRQGLRRLLSALTGNSASQPSPQEHNQYQANIAAIETLYQQRLSQANCL